VDQQRSRRSGHDLCERLDRQPASRREPLHDLAQPPGPVAGEQGVKGIRVDRG
jgi:hypothetical protein